jgi:hypothetical protein
MKTAGSVVLRLLGLLLLVTAFLKGWQLLAEPAANDDIWSYRPFLILQVEFELALGLWLVSGLFKRAAWLACLVCFSTFSAVTLYKGIIGVESCGCFGQIHINPWVTLFAIDLPVVVALLVFGPKDERLFARPSVRRLGTTACIGLIAVGTTTPLLAFGGKAELMSSGYEVLEPETWVGQRLPIFDDIGIGESLKKGEWVILLYRHNCPSCVSTIPAYEQMAYHFATNERVAKTAALIEVPPYGDPPLSAESACVLGKLSDRKRWFVRPALILLSDGIVQGGWTDESADLNAIIKCLAVSSQSQSSKNRASLVTAGFQRRILSCVFLMFRGFLD